SRLLTRSRGQPGGTDTIFGSGLHAMKFSLAPKLLDTYIANEFWPPLLFGIGIVTGVWFGADQLKTIFNLIMKAGVPINMALMILGLHLPEIIVMTIPIGVLLGTLLVFNRLS